MDALKQNIIKISEEILKELEKYKETNPDFTFYLRTKDSPTSKEIRFEEGFWFQGSDYIFVPLFKKTDTQRRIQTIGFVIHFNKDGSIKDNGIHVSFKADAFNEDEIKFHNEIAKRIGISIDKHNNGTFFYPDIDYIKNLKDFITRVRNICLEELKKFNLESNYIFTIDEFTQRLGNTNAVRINLTEDENEELDDEQLTKDELVSIITYIGSVKANEYFDLIDNIVRDLELGIDDPRLSFITARKNRLTLNIGKRKCFAIRPTKKKSPYYFISDNSDPKSQNCEVNPFSGSPEAFECLSTDFNNFRKYLPNIISASKKELERSSKSGFRRYNQSLFEKAVFDKQFRSEIFELAFKPINYWAINCNLEKWKGNLEIEQYNSGTWKVAKKYEKIIKKGDQFLIRFTGDKAGIYCFGTITGDPQLMEDDPERIKKFAEVPSEFTGSATRIPIDYDIKLLSNPIPNKDILNSGIFDEGTEQYNFFDNPQGVTTRDLKKEQFLKLKSMISDFNESIVIEKFRNYLNTQFTGKSTTANYLSFMPKIQSWFIEKETCPKDFNIWRDTDMIPKISNALENERKEDWKNINSRDNENGFYNAPWQKWIEFNNINNTGNTSVINKTNNTKDNRPKNIILYGPPGTGKTYNSIDKALEIADFNSYKADDHKSNKKRFDELKKEGQIEFVTFHQNYSYEDFMVGIRPDLDDTNKNLNFLKHKGVFYKICKRAEENYFNSIKPASVVSYNKWIEDQFEDFKDFVQSEIDLKSKFTLKNNVSIYSIEEDAFIYTGEKEDGSLWKNEKLGMHFDSLLIMIQNKVKERKDIKNLDNIRSLEKAHATYTIELINKFYEFLRLNNRKYQETSISEVKLKKYVIVIDEINRANISKVFGELITLLEDDKRIGEDEELWCKLSNGEDFGVPPNLYVIGTMNTADKSIALIDIALRRRFEFLGYYPKYKEDPSKGYDKASRELLEEINKAIYKERGSADYLIGHAYFMKGQDIDIVLLNKVIPLLMEYFSNKKDIVKKIFTLTKYDISYDETEFTWKVSLRK